MIQIFDYPCENRREAEQEEDKYMMEFKANMNSHRASRTQKQYYDDNRETYKNIIKNIVIIIKITIMIIKRI
jgi:hypothetical protein